MKRPDKLTIDLQRYKLAVDSSSNHIIFTDEHGYIIYANKAAEKTTGYSLAEMEGKTPKLWGGLMSDEFYKKMWKTLAEEKKPFVGEVKNKRKNGEVYTAIARISPIFNEPMHILGYVGTEEDITYRVMYENNLRELYKAKNQFISTASHQLRSPQGVIKWSTELLLDDKNLRLTAQQKTLLEQISKANKQMIELIDSLLKVARLRLNR